MPAIVLFFVIFVGIGIGFGVNISAQKEDTGGMVHASKHAEETLLPIPEKYVKTTHLPLGAKRGYGK